MHKSSKEFEYSVAIYPNYFEFVCIEDMHDI